LLLSFVSFFSQEFAEKLFKKLEGLTEKFEVKVMLLELVSRLMGRFIRIRYPVSGSGQRCPGSGMIYFKDPDPVSHPTWFLF
jgi:hypothetical protein